MALLFWIRIAAVGENEVSLVQALNYWELHDGNDFHRGILDVTKRGCWYIGTWQIWRFKLPSHMDTSPALGLSIPPQKQRVPTLKKRLPNDKCTEHAGTCILVFKNIWLFLIESSYFANIIISRNPRDDSALYNNLDDLGGFGKLCYFVISQCFTVVERAQNDLQQCTLLLLIKLCRMILKIIQQHIKLGISRNGPEL